MTTISVIIPTYNRAHYVRLATESALAQTYRNCEIIVVDDGSTDDTNARLLNLPGNVIYYRQPHSGRPAVGRNTGLRLATGEFVVFLDSDDLFVPDRLERHVARLQSEPQLAWVYSDTEYFADNGGIVRAGEDNTGSWPSDRPAQGRVFAALLVTNFIPLSSVTVRRSCLDAVGIFDESPRLTGVEDYDLWLRIAARYDIGYVPGQLSRMRVHGQNISGGTKLGQYLGSLDALAKIATHHAALVAPYRAILRQRRSLLYLAAARCPLSTASVEASYNVLGPEYRCQSTTELVGVSAIAPAPCPRVAGAAGKGSGRTVNILLVMTARTIGGAELYVERLVSALGATCRFTIVLSDHAELAELAGRLSQHATVLPFPFDRTGQLPAVAHQLRRLGAGFDVIHLNSNHPGSRLGILMGFALPGSGRPVVCVEQGASPIDAIEVPGSIAWALPALFRWSRRSVTQVVAVSEENRRALIDLYRLPAAKISVIHNGADLAPFVDPAPGTLRAELGLTPDQPLVIVLGRLAANKGQRFLVEAAPAILARFPTIHFAFAGNPEGRSDIEARIRALNLEPHFSLLGFRTDVVNLLRSSDVFVLPSLGEGFSLSIVEALAAELPVVATRVGGAAEIIEEGRTGFLVPPANATALGEAVIRVLSLSAKERDGFRRAAWEAAQHFSFEATANKLLEIYTRVSTSMP